MPKLKRTNDLCTKVVRDLEEDPTLTDKALAARYKCSRGTIRNIRFHGPVGIKKKLNKSWMKNDSEKSKTKTGGK